ncbi:hypothetical protein [Aquipuribacter nitratireducens]|uniref:DUF5666 domain-containing protein n=1 Tax=Aquipuribacter nitratireducens TaxID=650104 RepID=A0ABW0GMQ9_9MICO
MTLAACGGDSAGPESGVDLTEVADEDPTAGPGASEPATDPLAGDTVTVTGTVADLVSEVALRLGAEADETLLVMTVDQTLAEAGLASSDEDVVEEEIIEEERILQVTGTVRRYDPEEFEARYAANFEGLYEDSIGENVLVADSITTLPGQDVSVVGEVDEVLADAVFRVDGVDWEVVVVEEDTARVAEGDVVEVAGTVRRLDLATLEEELGADLDDELYADVEGRLVLVADSVRPVTASP